MRVTVRAPATTANLGPGFDCLGAALGLHLELTADTDAAPGSFTYTGPADEKPSADLVVAAVQAAAGSETIPGIDMNSEIPLGRGLGSSAAAIAAGLLAGTALAGRELATEELFALGLPLEGHPDNLAPALWGGLTLVVKAGERHEVYPCETASTITPAVLVAPEPLATAEARGVLPQQVRMSDVVGNLGRVSGLVALLTGGVDPTADRLLACTEDRLHQPHRAPLMPDTREVLERLRDAGVAAFVSGAGPSIGCVLVDETQAAFTRVSAGLKGWEVLHPGWDLEGAQVVHRED